ncbi:MAG: DUF2075 domain-containing protein [Spiribacter salinus]|uniref:DUF2075 domain-containing protein n=1 Tax=Spiribacter salinus TaxID=1335746 RepID=A0A540VNC0_9GAMM|nr:MAG: DUF2075 domain-containing protein [Spiribacter salinus]
MLVYIADKDDFLGDVARNRIEERILEAMDQRGLGRVSPAEIESWRNSLQYMKNVLEPATIPSDAGVAIEYRIPQTSKRIDFILSGIDPNARESCVIVELKQWQDVETTGRDAIVATYIGGARREVCHPSYQAWSYAALLEDFNETVQADAIRLHPCAYLHNCTAEQVRDIRYKAHLDNAPAFLRRDVDSLQAFIRQHVRQGDRSRILYRLERGRIRPSKELANALASLMRGNREFVMIDDQKVAYEAGLKVAQFGQGHGKQVLIVEGGPGSGKSVVGINLLVELIQRQQVTQYVTRNQAPREVFKARLSGTLKRTRIDNLFKGSGAYMDTEPNTFDTLIVDEAHRLNRFSGFYGNQGENQIKEIIRAARTSIFFIDEAQQVTWKDIGSVEEIEHWASDQGATVHRATLQSQFRCNGSDGYLSWLDHVLQIRTSARDDLAGIDYHLEVVDSPASLRDRIRALNSNGRKARLVAGYCWDWVSKRNDPNADDICFDEYDFAMQWNLYDDGGLWLEKDHSIDQIGCIHTAQGLELDYVGVIIGPDLIVRNGEIVTRPEKRARMDQSLKGYQRDRKVDHEAADRKADRIIRNTYRTLLSRGLRGCLIWCTDAETQAWFAEQVEHARLGADTPGEMIADAQPPYEESPTAIDETEEHPVRLIPRDEVQPTDNAVPFVDLPVAAGAFADFELTAGMEPGHALDEFEYWAKLPEHIRALSDAFVARIVGQSMNRCIPDGAFCLFRANPGGTRNGKIVVVHHRDIRDPDHGGALTVKRYQSEKVVHPDHGWHHHRIILACDTLADGYEDIVLTEDQASELHVIGELKEVLSDES